VRLTQSSKLESYKKHMAAAGVSKFAAFPPLWRMFWRIGIRIPPPVFLGFLSNTMIFGGFFGFFFASCNWLLRNFGVFDGSGASAPWLALIAGVPFGLAMAYEQYTLAKKHNVGSWDEFPGARERT
jgi:hypothetical protein